MQNKFRTDFFIVTKKKEENKMCIINIAIEIKM